MYDCDRVVYKYIDVWRVLVLACLMFYDQDFCFVEKKIVQIFLIYC